MIKIEVLVDTIESHVECVCRAKQMTRLEDKIAVAIRDAVIRIVKENAVSTNSELLVERDVETID